eukprot:gnl/TRDRNA2_/TRDRNA2_165146_c0_seq4.p1 gnl/TRDRNA2_/TRDRNA2_165146_c0~~gnl/TRDRNA2_/TRDRNA2_165146_c0_seq4.p1  ORF type:complete len:233 (+),score=46.74 gnl/TRDRNA2_/TRDRNA2_165146_c0_seq4:71-700(+)
MYADDSKMSRTIILAMAAGFMMGATVNIIYNSSSMAADPDELVAFPSVNIMPTQRFRSPAVSVITRGGAYHKSGMPPYSDNYLGKVKNAPLAGISQDIGGGFSPEQVAFMQRKGGAPSPAPAPSGGSGGFTAEQIAFMERQKSLRGGSSPAPAPAPSGGGGYSAEQLAFMERQKSGGYGGSSSSASSEGGGGSNYMPTKGKGYGGSYLR